MTLNKITGANADGPPQLAFWTHWAARVAQFVRRQHLGQIRHLMMKTPNVPFLSAVALSLVALFTACQSTPTRTGAELKSLQGHWVGIGESSGESITITGHSLHFYRDTNFWFETIFTLLAGTDPQVLRITIKDCSPPKGPIGQVPFALVKIEDGILTLASPYDGEAGRPQRRPKSFDDEHLAIYKLRKGELKTIMPNHPKPNEPKTP